jgi:serine/threonine-protein kinase
MLWAAATGVKLWKDTPDVQIMRRAISGDIPTPQSVNPECDDDLNAIVLKALAREPDDRYATALELQHDLETYVERFGAAAKQKEIARCVSTLFADTRAQLRALVERQLTLIPTDTSSISRERPRPGKGSNTLGGATSESIHTMLAEPIEPGRGKRRVLGVFAVLALLGAVSFYGWSHRGAAGDLPAATAEATAQVKPAAAAAPTAAAIARVSVTLKASPAEAKLFLDDQPLPTNPTTKLLMADGKAHVLRAEAHGFAKATSEFSPTEDTTVALSLTPVERSSRTNDAPSAPRYVVRAGRPVAVPTPTPAAAPAAAPVTAAPAAAAPSKPDCASPIFLDKDGIRRVRPECR